MDVAEARPPSPLTSAQTPVSVLPRRRTLRSANKPASSSSSVSFASSSSSSSSSASSKSSSSSSASASSSSSSSSSSSLSNPLSSPASASPLPLKRRRQSSNSSSLAIPRALNLRRRRLPPIQLSSLPLASASTASASITARHRRGRRTAAASAVMASCTLGGHLDTPTDLRNVLGPMLSDPQLHALCDVVLVVGGERFPAHRAVLAAASRVFKAMFTALMRERTATEIELPAQDAGVWRLVMDYIYRARVDLRDEEDALVLLSAARMYALERLEAFVARFLATRVTVVNALRLLDAAERFDLTALADACFAAMERDFAALAASPAFIRCPLRVIERLLSSGALVVRSERAVFDAAATWIHARPSTASAPNRLQDADRVFAAIRLDRLSDAEARAIGRDQRSRIAPHFRDALFERLLQVAGFGGSSPGSSASGGVCSSTNVCSVNGSSVTSESNNGSLGGPNSVQVEDVTARATTSRQAGANDGGGDGGGTAGNGAGTVDTQLQQQQQHQRTEPEGADAGTERVLALGGHLRARRRDANVLTVAHTLRGVTRTAVADDEEIVRSPWVPDASGRIVWRLKIYPRGYGKARGGFLSMYVQARAAQRGVNLDLGVRFDIFLVNRREPGSTITHSSRHDFQESSDHWGFHRFLQLGHLHNPNMGFLDEDSDSVIVGANVYLN